jgi:hypothetical protein
MSLNLQSGRTFEETIEALLKFMGYHTKASTTLHTRQAHIKAEIHHPKGKQRLLIECMHHIEESVGIREVEKFCSRIAFAREKAEADLGLLVSNTGFSPEAVIWCGKNCSFVQLKTYRQLISRSATIGKLLRPFHR